MGFTPLWPRLIKKQMWRLYKFRSSLEKEGDTAPKSSKKEKKKRVEENNQKIHTCIAAEETVLPSMDTTPCKGAIYLLMRTVISPREVYI